MKLEELKKVFNLNEQQVNQLDLYANFLIAYNEKVNLTAIVEYEDIIEKHFYDSLIPLLHKDIKGTLVDVGTGAGFPGVVLKIVRPDLKVLLLEPLNKRCVFLNELINKLIQSLDPRGFRVFGTTHPSGWQCPRNRVLMELDNPDTLPLSRSCQCK